MNQMINLTKNTQQINRQGVLSALTHTALVISVQYDSV